MDEIFFGKKHTYTPQIISSSYGTFICSTIDSFLISNPFFEKEIQSEIQETITKNKLKYKSGYFLNIGSHLGRYAIEYSEFFEKVYCFEPTPATFTLLTTNILLSKKENIKAFNEGLSNRKGELYFEINKSYESQNSIVPQKTKNSIKIPVSSFDETNIDKNKVSLVLIDVEGHELEVIQGMKLFLNNTEELSIIVEILSDDNVIKIKEELKSFKYKRIDQTNYLFHK